MWERTSFYPNFQLATSPLSGSLTEAFSVQEEFPVRTSTELLALLERFFKPQSTTSPLMFWEPVANLRKNRLELSATIFSRSVLA
jgi:hypothetical protein